MDRDSTDLTDKFRETVAGLDDEALAVLMICLRKAVVARSASWQARHLNEFRRYVDSRRARLRAAP